MTGFVQRNHPTGMGQAEGCGEEVVLLDLTTGRKVGFRLTPLDRHAEPTAAALRSLRAAVAGQVDLAVISRFAAFQRAGGKLGGALDAGIRAGLPVLTSIAGRCVHKWQALTFRQGAMLPPDIEALWGWWGPERLYQDLALGVAKAEVRNIVWAPAGCWSKGPMASDGCSFEGAFFTLAPCADALHLVHGPATCAGVSWGTRHTRTSFAGRDLGQMGFSTDLGELQVIYGGTRKLAAAIDHAVTGYRPAAVFVYETCVSALIGDDMDAVCADAAQRHGIPIVPVHAAGFVGNKKLGSRLALETAVEHLAGTLELALTTAYDINLIGEYNITGEMSPSSNA